MKSAFLCLFFFALFCDFVVKLRYAAALRFLLVNIQYGRSGAPKSGRFGEKRSSHAETLALVVLKGPFCWNGPNSQLPDRARGNWPRAAWGGLDAGEYYPEGLMAYQNWTDAFLKSLGKGAFGEVWLVADKECQRSLAMKVLLPDHRCKTEAVAQLANEARVMASLPKKHPDLVQIHFFKRGVANCFLAMELIEGKSLEKHTSVRKPMPWDRATRYLLASPMDWPGFTPNSDCSTATSNRKTSSSTPGPASIRPFWGTSGSRQRSMPGGGHGGL